MDKYLIKEQSLTNIGNSIREVVNDKDTFYTPEEMASVISSHMIAPPLCNCGRGLSYLRYYNQ